MYASPNAITVTEVENYVAFLALCTFGGRCLGGTVDPMILDIVLKRNI